MTRNLKNPELLQMKSIQGRGFISRLSCQTVSRTKPHFCLRYEFIFKFNYIFKNGFVRSVYLTYKKTTTTYCTGGCSAMVWPVTFWCTFFFNFNWLCRYIPTQQWVFVGDRDLHSMKYGPASSLQTIWPFWVPFTPLFLQSHTLDGLVSSVKTWRHHVVVSRR